MQERIRRTDRTTLVFLAANGSLLTITIVLALLRADLHIVAAIAGVELVVLIVGFWHRTLRALVMVLLVTAAFEVGVSLSRLPGTIVLVAAATAMTVTLLRFEELISELPAADARFEQALRDLTTETHRALQAGRTVENLRQADITALERLSRLTGPTATWEVARLAAADFYATRLSAIEAGSLGDEETRGAIAARWRTYLDAFSGARSARLRWWFGRPRQQRG
jgi:hypothetical protein